MMLDIKVRPLRGPVVFCVALVQGPTFLLNEVSTEVNFDLHY